MHIKYEGGDEGFSIVGIKRKLFKEMVQILDKSATSPELRAGLYDIRDDIEAMAVATLDHNSEYVWTIDEEDLPF